MIRHNNDIDGLYHFRYICMWHRVAERKYQPSSTGLIVANEPVREWLLGLSKADRKAIGADIQTVEFGWPVGMPVCRPMKDGLYEVRTNLDDGRIARVLFCFHGNKMVLLHGIIKKSQKTPKPDLDLTKKRKREVEHG